MTPKKTITHDELIAWMRENEEFRHQLRDEEAEELKLLIVQSIFYPAPSIKQAFYLGYLKGKNKPDVPEEFKKALGE